MKPLLVLVAVAFVCNFSNAGWFSDDPVKIEPKPIYNLVNKDEIEFTLLEYLVIREPRLTLELKYSDTTQKVHASEKEWTKGGKIKIKIPNNLHGLKEFRLTGKCEGMFSIEHDKAGDRVKGYKIDSAWYGFGPRK